MLFVSIYEYNMMSSGASDKICKDGSSKGNNDDVCEVNDKLQYISTADNMEDNDKSVCQLW